MNLNRRNFLKSSVLAGTACVAGAARADGWSWLFGGTEGSPMHGFAAPVLKHIRVGIVGVGGRGRGVIPRIANLPGITVTALCDNDPNKIAVGQRKLAELGKPKAKEFCGETAWRALCDDPGVDVVYNTTPWDLHVPVALAAMRGGKHVFTEVPSAFTVDDCWELVETSERTKRHCMQLENCCYGEVEMLTFNLAKLGMLGEIVHAEGGYIHDLKWMTTARVPAGEYWRFDHNRDHAGNAYPTHGLVPLCLTMDINRGDRMDYLVSVDSKQVGFTRHMERFLKPDDPRRLGGVKMGDMNSTLIKTALGKTILVQHDVSSPRPYSRIQLVSGTKGAICDYPYRVAFEEKPGAEVHGWFEQAKADEIMKKYMHPLYKSIGELGKRVGGHGGMDFIMDARWVYCLQQGLPLDMDVYDLATTCCICELTERSATHRGESVDVPDFTRGAWKTTKPMEVVDIDVEKFGIDMKSAKKATDQMSV